MNEYEFILNTLEKAGEKLLELRAQEVIVSFKDGNPRDILTSVDTEINSFIVEEIQKNFPSDSIYSEEAEDALGDTERLWVIDPIDGSSNFSRGIPHFAICIGLLERGIPVAGGVLNPVTRELFSFKKGEGAFLNGKPIHVSNVTDPKDAFALLHAGRRPEVAIWGGESYRRLLGSVKKTSNLGSSALDACFVACGRVEANIYGTLTTLDIASALGILTEAGGVVHGADGGALSYSKEPQRIYMANSEEMFQFVTTLLEN